jgi:AraC-like DNA-binding protein
VAEPVLESVAGRPAPALHGLIDRYVGYRQEGIGPGTNRGLPSRHLTFIVSLAEPVDIAGMVNPAQSPGTFAAFAAGLHAAPATIRHEGRQYGIHLDLTPWGARALFGVPAAAMAWTVVDLADLLGPLAASLPDRLAAGCATWPERFAVLDEVLTGAVAARDARRDPPAEVTWAWQRLVASGGTVEVGALAKEVGWSRRHLGERFRAELGLSPKLAGRVIRFDQARRLLQQPGPTRRPTLADAAAATGYFDQAHMTRDFRELAGCTPTTWLAEEFPSFQDETVEAGAS